jgi:N-acetylmuramoyl-L-alanine amidase
MQESSIYFIKVMASSGVLYLYYRTFLYNRAFHQWNRFYLLLSVLASIIIPLIQLKVFPPSPITSQPSFTGLLNTVVSNKGWHEYEGALQSQNNFVPSAIMIMYMIGCSVMLIGLIHALTKLYKLSYRLGFQQHNGFRIVFMNDQHAPFSFFKYIFWNSSIDLNSETGKNILHHEQVHAQQWHSADKVLMNTIMIFFWFNPFFWMIKRELSLVHEFIADSETIPDGNPAFFSSMILSTMYPSVKHTLTSHFSFSPVKRRLLMLSQLKTFRKNYFSRLLLLPVLFGLLAAFSFTHKNGQRPTAARKAQAINKVYTIVVDAGHGGEDPGAQSPDGVEEKDIVLAIAKKVKELNTNASIHIQLTRSTDVFQEIKNKVDVTVAQKADAFISLHVNKDSVNRSGFDLIISKRDSRYIQQSRQLGTALSKEIQQIYPVFPGLQRRISKGVWVLDAPTINYPSVMLSCGNIDNPKDLAYITDPIHQNEIALQILKGIGDFIGSLDTQ